ncbi:hypothetical protein D3272_04140 [Lichenibacterium ramalinae]|uniref:Uncharacterized protein n=1 Tax=Lichenibacterium ramalinae TaxID=2316527 RepID=A0A4Q2RJ46_9HYPH|nr:hypothetical protein D3272_04140 [Lichenibacterium ramalinae]
MSAAGLSKAALVRRR